MAGGQRPGPANAVHCGDPLIWTLLPALGPAPLWELLLGFCPAGCSHYGLDLPLTLCCISGRRLLCLTLVEILGNLGCFLFCNYQSG